MSKLHFAALAGELRLIAGLDPLTKRDLVQLPPRNAETMQQVGISKTNLDGPVRSWINASFREPNNLKPPLKSGSITPATRWEQLKTMAGV